MLFAIGAASSALGLLKSLTSPAQMPASAKASSGFAASASSDGATASAPGTPASSVSAQGRGLSPQTMTALLEAQGATAPSSPASPAGKAKALKDLFALLDSDGDGRISKAEFEDTLGAGGTNIAKADSVFGRLDQDSDGSVSLDELSAALKGGKSRHRHAGQPADADGSRVTVASPAATAPGTAIAFYNLTDQAVRQQARTINVPAASALSVSV